MRPHVELKLKVIGLLGERRATAYVDRAFLKGRSSVGDHRVGSRLQENIYTKLFTKEGGSFWVIVQERVTPLVAYLGGLENGNVRSCAKKQSIGHPRTAGHFQCLLLPT